MSVIRRDGLKILLPRLGRDVFWKMVHERYLGTDAARWKSLAMLALRENAGWELEQIATVFDHTCGHVSRCLKQVKQALRVELSSSPDWRRLLEELGDAADMESDLDETEGTGTERVSDAASIPGLVERVREENRPASGIGASTASFGRGSVLGDSQGGRPGEWKTGENPRHAEKSVQESNGRNESEGRRPPDGRSGGRGDRSGLESNPRSQGSRREKQRRNHSTRP